MVLEEDAIKEKKYINCLILYYRIYLRCTIKIELVNKILSGVLEKNFTTTCLH